MRASLILPLTMGVAILLAQAPLSAKPGMAGSGILQFPQQEQSTPDTQVKTPTDSRTRTRQELEQAIATARGLDSAGIEDTELLIQLKEINALVRQAEELGYDASLESQQKLTRSLSRSVRKYRQAAQSYLASKRNKPVKTPPKALRKVAEAYFSGDYQGAVRLARPFRLDNESERIQAFLFRAAARYNLYILSGEQDEDLLRQAQNDVRSIRQLDSGFIPYVAAFSPKFLTFFEQTN